MAVVRVRVFSCLWTTSKIDHASPVTGRDTLPFPIREKPPFRRLPPRRCFALRRKEVEKLVDAMERACRGRSTPTTSHGLPPHFVAQYVPVFWLGETALGLKAVMCNRMVWFDRLWLSVWCGVVKDSKIGVGPPYTLAGAAW